MSLPRRLAIALLMVGCNSPEVSVDRVAAIEENLAERVASGCGRFVTKNNDTFLVTPSGAEDTANIQCAIDHVGRGTVRLAAGTFYTAQIIKAGFMGKLRGAGADRTTITNVARPLDVAADWTSKPPSASNLWPSLFDFVDGTFTISDLTIKITGTDPTVPFEAFGFHFTTLGHGISITGARAVVTIENISIEGESSSESNLFVNLLNGIDVENIAGSDPTPLAISLTVRDSTFKHFGAAVAVTNLIDSDVRVVDNVFQEMFFAGSAADLTDSHYLFAENEVDAFVDAFDQYDQCLGPSSSCGMTNSSLRIVENTVDAPIVFEGTFNNHVRCRVADNEFTNTGLQLFLGPGTHDCVATGITNYIDKGTNNKVRP